MPVDDQQKPTTTTPPNPPTPPIRLSNPPFSNPIRPALQPPIKEASAFSPPHPPLTPFPQPPANPQNPNPNSTTKKTGQRGLSPTVLRKYGVGCATFSFLNGHNQYEPAECVVFPWMVETTPTAATPAPAPVAPTKGGGRKGGRKAAAVVLEGEAQPPRRQEWATKRCKIRAVKEKAWQR